MDEEVKKAHDLYNELQAEFKAAHQNVAALRSESMSPAQIKKEITQLESEKEQLVARINMFKDKANDKEF